MRICVPTEGNGGLDDRVGEHFGRSPTYTIYDTETGEVEILPNTSEHLGGSGLPAELLAQAGVDVVSVRALVVGPWRSFPNMALRSTLALSGRFARPSRPGKPAV